MPTILWEGAGAQARFDFSLHPARLAALRALLIGWGRKLLIWIERSRQRTALQEIAEDDDHLLQDIGKSRQEALREAGKPFWQQ
jgi:uncharacterized protein YjiS (DUF1127 family)